MRNLFSSKKAKTIVTFLLLFSAIVHAQKKITGSVINKKNETLVGATITILELQKSLFTDFEGKFQINLPQNKVYNLEISYIGYTTKTVNTNSLQNNNQIVLSSTTDKLDEVLVSAIRANENTPVTYSNVSKEEIAKRNLGQDIPVLLNYLPSVVSSTDAGAGVGYTNMRVRGSDASRVNVTINGIPYNDAESQGTFWVNINDLASSTENLQLQRGVGTSTNGSAAFGASLNILTDAVAEEAGGEISQSLGSYNTRKTTAKFTTGKVNDHFEFSGRISDIYSDGYVDRAYADLQSYFLQASYVDDKTLIKALTFGGKEKTYQAWFGVTKEQIAEDRTQNPYTYDNETDNYWQDHYQLHINRKLDENLSINLGLNHTKGEGYFEQFKPEESATDFNNLIVDNSDVIVRRWLDNDFYVANLNLTYTTNQFESVLGASYSHYTNNHFGEVIWGSNLADNVSIRDRYYESDATKIDFSAFSKTNVKVTDQINAYIDLQYRRVDYKTAGLDSDRSTIDIDKTFNFFNPKAGLVFRLDDENSFYGSYARANREPNRNDFLGGTSQHESLNDYELGWRYKSENAQINTNFYLMDYQNQLVLSGALNDVGEAIRISSGESYRLGLEVDAHIKITEFLSISPNIALSKNRNKDFYFTKDGVVTDLGDTPISYSPDIVFGNAITVQPIENLQVSLFSKYVSDQYMGNLGGAVSGIEKLKSFFTNDFNVVYEIKTNKVFKSIVLTGLINNVLDVEYSSNGYYYTFDDTWTDPNATTTLDGAGFYPQATRNFLAGVTFKF